MVRLGRRWLWLVVALVVAVGGSASTAVYATGGIVVPGSDALCDTSLTGVAASIVASTPTILGQVVDPLAEGTTSCWQYAAMVTQDQGHVALPNGAVLQFIENTFGVFGTHAFFVKQYFAHGSSATLTVSVAPTFDTWNGITDASSDFTISTANWSREYANIPAGITQVSIPLGSVSGDDFVNVGGLGVVVVGVSLDDPSSYTPTPTVTPTPTPGGPTPTATPIPTGHQCGYINDCWFQLGQPGAWTCRTGGGSGLSQGTICHSDPTGGKNPWWSGPGPAGGSVCPTANCTFDGATHVLKWTGTGGSGSLNYPWDPPISPGALRFSVWEYDPNAAWNHGCTSWDWASGFVNCSFGQSTAGLGWVRFDVAVSFNGTYGLRSLNFPSNWPATRIAYWFEPCVYSGSLPAACNDTPPSIVGGVVPTATPVVATSTPTSTPICGIGYCGIGPTPLPDQTPVLPTTPTPNGGWTGSAYASSCPGVTWGIVTTPPDDLFPSGLRNTWLIGGVVQAAAAVVGGMWSIFVHMIVPQHTACDLSGLVNTLNSHISLPDVTQYASTFNITSTTCISPTYLGLGSLVFPLDNGSHGGSSHSAGLNICAEPWLTWLPRLRGLIGAVLYSGLVVWVYRLARSLFVGGGDMEGED